ncbi:hypothetical protein BCR33DRAFT_94313 [Rhizoclosmatium globosum]|uniref:Uncharacterized protein n=1 Tax=Rhizoclosmatium globosum TaxID=329046 RepID=A0A1Y2CKE8_9FUNG|nr:hypothetical protein BCR33DRAFT_94313 [Rhizoclosmatium globosum]|eukprot:ORY47334.1 hypothetical protein BCR33DRAFT_94313 [Rhizoclosmatium globosum]
MSSDSLVLEEEEIVLENTKADGVVSSAAFFIPLETELKVSGGGGGGKKDTVKEQELASYPPSEINIDEDTESVGKTASIAHAEPVVVVVAPQQTSPKALSTPRTSTSDAWIKEKNGVIAANISDSFLIGKESPRHTAGSGKSGKKSNSGRVKEEVGDKDEKVPIVVVKMSAESPTSPRKPSGSPSKIRHQKPKAFPPDTYSPSTPRDSAVTLVNRDSMVSLKRDSQGQPSFGERVMVNRALLPDNGPFGELGMKEEIYPQASHRMSLTQRGYVPMPTSKAGYNNSTQYVTKFGSPMPDLVRQYNQSSPSSSLRSSTSTYTSSHSSQSLRSHQPYQSQSHLYTNRNIHKWAATSSTPSLQYQTSPLSMDPQITPTPPPTSHSPAEAVNLPKQQNNPPVSAATAPQARKPGHSETSYSPTKQRKQFPSHHPSSTSRTNPLPQNIIRLYHQLLTQLRTSSRRRRYTRVQRKWSLLRREQWRRRNNHTDRHNHRPETQRPRPQFRELCLRTRETLLHNHQRVFPDTSRNPEEQETESEGWG